MDQLYESMFRQLEQVPTDFRRYLFGDIKWENRMFGLIGPRGVGKTTLFLQRIQHMHASGAPANTVLYISADHMYFANHTLYETSEAFNKDGGIYLFIDEVHKYPGWSQELKAIYDAFPDMHIYFTGSSILDIEKGEADLSRRAPRYFLQGLSFREFLAIQYGIMMPAFTLEEICNNEARLCDIAHPLPYFKEYLKSGYYPFGSDPDFFTELEQVISRTLETDIPQFAGMTAATGRKLKRLMATVSTLVPFKPNMADLSRRIGISRNNVEDYLRLLEKAGMIAGLQSAAGGMGALGKTEKLYLDNTNILYCLSNGVPNIGTVRETFFFNQIRTMHRVTSSRYADFCVDDVHFEIGGKNKGTDQLKNSPKGYIVKDDIEYGHANTIALWAFGLTY